MADPTVAVNFAQTLDVQRNIPAQVTFHMVVVDLLTDLLNFIIGQVTDASVRIDPCILQNFIGAGTTDTENVGQADFHSFVFWYINTCYTCQIPSPPVILDVAYASDFHRSP